MNRIIKCLKCGQEQNLESWINDDLGYHAVCVKCNNIFDISECDAKSILLSPGTKVIFNDNEMGIIDSNDFENGDEFENINYYICREKDTHLKIWSSKYEMLLRSEFTV